MTGSDREQHDQFLRLFMGLEESLRVFVRSLLFTHDEEREVMQEVAVVLWRKFDPSMDSEAFCRWAFGVARMEALAFRRDRARDRHTFGDEVFELLAQTVLEQSDSLEAERRALDTCLQKLPEDQRYLVRTAYSPGIKIDHLAKQLGRTAMALYKALHRIRLTLMDCTRRELATEELT
jgi:RNA polymerase sigma-70 factor (ECF subfamily)